MVKTYTCEKCGKVFNQKGHYINHLNRKTPCKPIENKIIEEKVQEKILELSAKGDIEIKNTNLISSTNNANTDNMDKDPNDMDISELKEYIAKIKSKKLVSNNQNSNNEMKNISKKDIPRPLLKWVGGKGQIIDKLIKQIPKKINNYHEIFVGGGSFLIMILWAKEKGIITIDGDINVYDLNEALIESYNNIKNNKNELFESIKQIEAEFNSCEIDGDVKRKPVNKEDAAFKEKYPNLKLTDQYERIQNPDGSWKDPRERTANELGDLNYDRSTLGEVAKYSNTGYKPPSQRTGGIEDYTQVSDPTADSLKIMQGLNVGNDAYSQTDSLLNPNKTNAAKQDVNATQEALGINKNYKYSQNLLDAGFKKKELEGLQDRHSEWKAARASGTLGDWETRYYPDRTPQYKNKKKNRNKLKQGTST